MANFVVSVTSKSGGGGGEKEKSKLIFHGQTKGSARNHNSTREWKCLWPPSAPRNLFSPFFCSPPQRVNIPMEFFNRNVIPLNLMEESVRERGREMEWRFIFLVECHNFHPSRSRNHKVINRTTDHQSFSELQELQLIYNDSNYFWFLLLRHR